MTPRILVPIVTLGLLASVCHALEFKAADQFNLPAGQTTSNELWLQARTIHFAGKAQDDCFFLADSVGQATSSNPATLKLSGLFDNDVWGLGENIEFTGIIQDHARLAAMKTLIVAGTIEHNLIGLAPTITLATNAMIHGNGLLAGQDILLYGEIAGTTRVFGNKVTLSGHFGGDVTITATDINVMPGTSIDGNLIYSMEEDLVLDSRVALGGKIIKREWTAAPEKPYTSGTLILQLGLLCGAIMVGLLFISIMPGFVALGIHKLSESPWRCFLFGFITFALVPMTAFFLLFTLVGIPLSAVLMLAYLLLMYLSKIITGLYLGHLILRRKPPLPSQLLFPLLSLGLLVIYGVVNLPFPLGAIAWFGITLCGLGALVGAMLDRRIPVLISYPPDSQGKPPPLPGNVPPGAV